jgi:hypothetical protein
VRLTEAMLERQLEEHRDACDQCEPFPCDDANRIEASFWNEVDRQIDEAKERGDDY